LRYRVKKIAGQTVDLIESAPTGQRVIKRIKTGGRGKVTYTPAEATGTAREVQALVAQNGMPRETITIAKYRAPNPKLAKPKVKVRRKGSKALVRWNKVPGAMAYNVSLQFSDGRAFPVKPAPGARAVIARGVGKKGGVVARVSALTATGRTATGVGRLKEVKPKRQKTSHKPRHKQRGGKHRRKQR
jgi:hypothetical protein